MNRRFARKSMALMLVLLILQSGNLLNLVPSVQAETEGEYEYFLVDGGSAVRLSSYHGTDQQVVIPDQLGGLDVVEISTGAFRSKQLTEVRIPSTVREIGYEAFAYNALTEVVIPDSVVELGEYVFRDNQLNNVQLSGNLTSISWGAFLNNQLQSITIPNSVTAIGAIAFVGNQLVSLELPNNVTTIGERAFEDNQLTELILPHSVVQIEWAAFKGNQLTNLVLSNSLTTIESNTFANNQLTTVSFPSSLTTIREDAFRENQLSTLIIPDTVTTIATGAFSDNQLIEVTISNNLTTIEAELFSNNQLTEVIIPDSVTEIGWGAFKDNQLQELNIPGSVTKIIESAFENNHLTELILPGSLKEIGQMAFSENQISQLTIEDGVEIIGPAAFMSNELTELTLPGSVKQVAPGAFHSNALSKLTIEEGVETIGFFAFMYNDLQEVTLPASVTSVEMFAFGANNIRHLMFLNPTTAIGDNLLDSYIGADIILGNREGVTIFGQDPSTAKTFAEQHDIHFHEINAELSNLEVNIPGMLFDPNERSFSVMTNATSVVVTATSVVPFSEVQINGVIVPYGSSSQPIHLADGIEIIIVDVEAPDASTERYEITLDVDQIAPEIELSPNPTTPTNAEVVVSVELTESGSGISEDKWASGEQAADYFASEGEMLSESNEFTVSDNGVYTVYARDHAGNEAVETISISNIHRTAPSITLQPSPTGPTNGDVTIAATVTAADDSLEISSLKWASGEQEAEYFIGEGQLFNALNQFIVSENGIYTVYARDSVGNEAVETITIANIDRLAPTIELTPSSTSPMNENVLVTVEVEEVGSGISDLKWARGEQVEAFFASGGAAITDVFTVSENDIYTVYVRDYAGNEAITTIMIANIDRQAPTIDLTPSSTSPTNGNVLVTVEVEEVGSGINNVKWASGEQSATYFTSQGEVLPASNEFTVSENGIYTVYARDLAGNEAVETITIANIYRTAPSIDLLSSSTSPTNGDVSIAVTVTAGHDELEISSLKWASGEHEVEYFTSGGEVLSASNEFTVSDNGVYTVYARDLAGNEAVEIITIANIYRIAPSFDLLPNPTSPTNGDVTVEVTIAAGDEDLEITSMKWARGDQEADYFDNSGEDVNASNEFTASANGIYTVYGRDNAGNEGVETITISNIYRIAPSIELQPSPTGPTNGDVTIAVTATASTEVLEITSSKWASGEQLVDYFASEGEVLTESNEFTASENGIYTVYARDSVGNETIETITVANIYRTAPSVDLIPSPTSSTSGNVTVTVTVTVADDDLEITSLKWARGDQEADYFASEGEDVSASNEFIVRHNDIYTVYARDNAGNETVESMTIQNIYRPTPTQPAQPDTKVELEGGVIIIRVSPKDIVSVEQDNGEIIEKVNLPEEVLDGIPKLLEQVERPIIRIDINDSKSAVQLPLPAELIEKAQNIRSNVVFEARLNGSSFQLEVNVLDLKELAAQLGTDLKNIDVNIIIKAVTGTKLIRLVQAAEQQGMQLLSEAIEFQLIVSGGGKSLEISDFGGTYMLKSIVLDDSIANKNYTAVLYHPENQSFTFVPAVSARLANNRLEAVMRMPHNSMYAIMEVDEVRFTDMSSHWAKEEVEYLASKLVVSGVSKTMYAPDRAITRAEFTALLVRALGLRVQSIGDGHLFEDVPADAWYTPFVEAGAKSGLVNGLSEMRFAPEEVITREQMAVMLANARKIVEGDTMSSSQATSLLSKFDDAVQISSWAKEAMAEAIATGRIQGVTADKLAPTATATRAQAAVMLERFMREIEFLE